MNVLSIQSHVSFGYVGNSAAVFALQRMGHEVWPVHTLSYSNHPGYGDFEGSGLEASALESILKGLERRGAFAACDAVLSGYLGNVALGAPLLDAIRAVRNKNPSAFYCCDPVIGDIEDGAYLPENVAEFLARELVTRADIVTPNVFELGCLTGRVQTSPKEILASAEALRDRGAKRVVITGVSDNSSTVGAILVEDGGAWRVDTPRIDFGRRADGAGDLFTALFLGSYLDRRDAVYALGNAASAVYGILLATFEAQSREPLIIQAQEQIIAPSNVLKPFRID